MSSSPWAFSRLRIGTTAPIGVGGSSTVRLNGDLQPVPRHPDAGTAFLFLTSRECVMPLSTALGLKMNYHTVSDMFLNEILG
jgi:hypothetical protein